MIKRMFRVCLGALIGREHAYNAVEEGEPDPPPPTTEELENTKDMAEDALETLKTQIENKEDEVNEAEQRIDQAIQSIDLDNLTSLQEGKLARLHADLAAVTSEYEELNTMYQVQRRKCAILARKSIVQSCGSAGPGVDAMLKRIQADEEEISLDNDEHHEVMQDVGQLLDENLNKRVDVVAAQSRLAVGSKLTADVLASLKERKSKVKQQSLPAPSAPAWPSVPVTTKKKKKKEEESSQVALEEV